MIEKNITIINKLGLHARAAAKFVTEAAHYASDIHVKRGKKEANGKSIMGIMLLAASKGTELTLSADGSDEKAAIHALETLINNKFGESE